MDDLPLLHHRGVRRVFGWVRVPDPTSFGRWRRRSGRAMFPLLDTLLWRMVLQRWALAGGRRDITVRLHHPHQRGRGQATGRKGGPVLQLCGNHEQGNWDVCGDPNQRRNSCVSIQESSSVPSPRGRIRRSPSTQREGNTPMRLAPRVAVPILFLAILAVSGFTTEEPVATAADELSAVTIVTDMDVRTAHKLTRPMVTCTGPVATDAPEAAQRRLDYYRCGHSLLF